MTPRAAALGLGTTGASSASASVAVTGGDAIETTDFIEGVSPSTGPSSSVSIAGEDDI